jgi:hypothetical protein
MKPLFSQTAQQNQVQNTDNYKFDFADQTPPATGITGSG